MNEGERGGGVGGGGADIGILAGRQLVRNRDKIDKDSRKEGRQTAINANRYREARQIKQHTHTHTNTHTNTHARTHA